MKAFYCYLKEYFSKINLLSFLITTLFVALLVLLNYSFGIEKYIRAIAWWPIQFFVFYIFFTSIFFIAYFFSLKKFSAGKITESKSFFLLLFAAPAIFSLKMIFWQTPSFIVSSMDYPWNRYWPAVLQLPLKLLLIVFFLAIIWKWKFNHQPFFGFAGNLPGLKPYFIIVLCLIPAISFASTQYDFLHAYPKLKSISFINGYASPLWPWRILYEISYGLDFISIELFFRGFLVIGFGYFVGINAILPMAAFYCTIHFGKPIAECITSYAGGLVLGVIAHRTRSVVGGLIVHLGLAWMMEIGGYAGLLYLNAH